MDTASVAANELLERHHAWLARVREVLAEFQRTTAPHGLSVLEPLNEMSLALANVASEAGLLAEVHPDASVRDAAEAMDRACSELRTEILQDGALHLALVGIADRELDEVTTRVRALTLTDMRRAGANLGDRDRARVRALRLELLPLEQEFNRNIRDDVRSVEVTDADVEGLPADWVAAHPPNARGTRMVTTSYPDLIPFMSYSRSDAARRALTFANLNRATPRNLEVLRRILGTRAELAHLLGYASWAEYATADKMSGSVGAVRGFIERAYAATRESCAAEREQILAAKRRADPSAAGIGQWEHAYWVERIKTDALQFDPRSVRPYFEYAHVKHEVLALVGRLFGLTFAEVDQPGVWHPSVETYEVTMDGRRMGRISLDMHPREGKFKHAACFTWRPGLGGRQEPHSVLVCNFPDPAGAGPALMEHSEVVTFFHEFGHLVHNIVRGEIRWMRVSGIAEWDFVEAPSQFLEEWIYDAEVLGILARHFETGAAIPDETVASLRGARDFGRGMFVQRQLFLAAVSLELHDLDPRDLDTTRVVHELAARYSPTELLPETHFEASFGHLEGYSAAYYTYMWSLVIAKDLFGAFADGPLDVAQARRYRDIVLAQGGVKPAARLVEEFLGRPYSFDSFAEWLRPRG